MKPQLFLLLLCLLCTSAAAQSPKFSEVVRLNGADLYYEVYGQGPPLFLLHGFTQSTKAWLPFVEDYAGEYEVYLVDLRGHGKASLFTENISLKTMASDVSALVDHLNLDTIQAIGFSMGGEVLLNLAVQQPGLITSMVIIGANGTIRQPDSTSVWLKIDYDNYEKYIPWIKTYQYDEAHIQGIIDQIKNFGGSLTESEYRSIQTKTMFVMGDKESSGFIDDAVFARKLVNGAHLWVVPDTGHGAHRDKNKVEFVRLSRVFLEHK